MQIDIRKNIKALAKERGLSMKQLCELLNLSERTFRHRLSSDETITIAFLKEIATALECDLISIINNNLQQNIMKTYYISYPRNFANEYSLISVEKGNEKQEEMLNKLIEVIENGNGEVSQITRKDAEARAAENRRRYKSGEANYNNPAGATEIISILDMDL